MRSIQTAKDIIEQAVTPILDDQGIQERAQTMLTENKRYPNRKNDRRYLIRGLVKCAACGAACSGHPATSRGKKFHYYTCHASWTNNFSTGARTSRLT
jgi:hypothetical protein